MAVWWQYLTWNSVAEGSSRMVFGGVMTKIQAKTTWVGIRNTYSLLKAILTVRS